LSILKTAFSLFSSSEKYTKALASEVSRFKLKRLASNWAYFQQSLAGWRKGHKVATVVVRQPSYLLFSWIKYVLVVCGLLTLLSAMMLVFNLDWRAKIALNLMPSEAISDTLSDNIAGSIQQKTNLRAEIYPVYQYEGHTAVFTEKAAPVRLISDEPALVQYIAKRYRIANTVTQQLVTAAFKVGDELNLDPLLILAVMAIESRFNPYAESGAGAQGLMQVMTRVHEDKYKPLGGRKVALHPPANIRVGAQILRDCINRAGTLEGGLKFYVGATTPTDGGYGARVLAERQRMRQAAGWIGHKKRTDQQFELAAQVSS
jgi:hypothetical protein